ncbi:MAG TPA: hypothetical protein PLD27_10475 [bacterium]|nr:hypothetical protein [bacterium]HPQ19353.1 hypothetical protein [bacterium]
MKIKKVLLVYPKTYNLNYRNISEPLGLGYIASYLKKFGDYDFKLIVQDLSNEREIQEYIEWADLIAISATSTQFYNAQILASQVKKKFSKKNCSFGWLAFNYFCRKYISFL